MQVHCETYFGVLFIVFTPPEDSVNIAGWDFPHLEVPSSIHKDLNWIGQEFGWEDLLELWRFYQSGQFVHFSRMRDDWQNELDLPAQLTLKPGTTLGIGRTVLRFTEAFEFGARLALTEAGDERMRIEVSSNGLQARKLRLDSSNRWPLVQEYKASIDKFPYLIELPRAELISKPRELALIGARELFLRFDWKPTLDDLRDWQASLYR